jgi:apolipoprotein D and lipocalin family protein
MRYIVLLVLLSCTLSPVMAQPIPPLQPVEKVAIDKYLGRWFEIARLDTWFEKDCKNVYTDLSLSADGKILSNKHCIVTETGEEKFLNGRTRINDRETNAKHSISYIPVWISWFDPLLSSPVWILKLDPDYQIVLLGSPFFDYFWLLSRTPHLDDATQKEYMDAARDLGYDVSKIHITEQDQS